MDKYLQLFLIVNQDKGFSFRIFAGTIQNAKLQLY